MTDQPDISHVGAADAAEAQGQTRRRHPVPEPRDKTADSQARWTVRGIGIDVRAQAVAAAEAQGLTVGEWLTQAIAAQLSERPEQPPRSLDDIAVEDLARAHVIERRAFDETVQMMRTIAETMTAMNKLVESSRLEVMAVTKSMVGLVKSLEARVDRVETRQLEGGRPRGLWAGLVGKAERLGPSDKGLRDEAE